MVTDKFPHCKVILFPSFQLISNLWDDLCHHLTIMFSNNISQNGFIIHWCSMPNPLLHWCFKQNEFSGLALILPLFPGFLYKKELLVPLSPSLSLSLPLFLRLMLDYHVTTCTHPELGLSTGSWKQEEKCWCLEGSCNRELE